MKHFYYVLLEFKRIVYTGLNIAMKKTIMYITITNISFLLNKYNDVTNVEHMQLLNNQHIILTLYQDDSH